MTGMDFYIRPRQDFSLSRMADAMRCLHCRGLYPALCVLEEKKKHVVVIRIEAVGDRKQLTEKAIKMYDKYVITGFQLAMLHMLASCDGQATEIVKEVLEQKAEVKE